MTSTQRVLVAHLNPGLYHDRGVSKGSQLSPDRIICSATQWWPFQPLLTASSEEENTLHCFCTYYAGDVYFFAAAQFPMFEKNTALPAPAR